MKHLTVRELPPELAKALTRETKRRHQSLNATVKELLARALGVGTHAPFDNGLGKFAGGWSAADLAEFERATAQFERVDEEDWK